MAKSAAGLLASIVAVQGAYASTWQDAAPYELVEAGAACSTSQRAGYDWAGLSLGAFTSYGSNDFRGFNCTSAPGQSRRDLIVANLDRGPSMKSKNSQKMTLATLYLSTSQDAYVECEYAMSDGSICHESYACSETSSPFENTQCAGASSVTFRPGENAPAGCSVSVHSVDFHCGPSSASGGSDYSTSATVSASVTSTAQNPKSTSSLCSTGSCTASNSSSTPPECTGSSCSSRASSASTPPALPRSKSSFSASSTAPSNCTQSFCSSRAFSASTPPSPYSLTSTFPPSASSTTQSSCTQGTCSSKPLSASMKPSPYPSGSTSSPDTSSTTPSSGSHASCQTESCLQSAPSAPLTSAFSLSRTGSDTGTVVTTQLASSTVPGSTAATTSSYPSVLPRCLNTFLSVAGCHNNTDVDCFCPSHDFIKQSEQCINAWSKTNTQAETAILILQGLCLPSNMSASAGIGTTSPSNTASNSGGETSLALCTSSTTSSPSAEAHPVSASEVFTVENSRTLPQSTATLTVTPYSLVTHLVASSNQTRTVIAPQAISHTTVGSGYVTYTTVSSALVSGTQQSRPSASLVPVSYNGATKEAWSWSVMFVIVVGIVI